MLWAMDGHGPMAPWEGWVHTVQTWAGGCPPVCTRHDEKDDMHPQERSHPPPLHVIVNATVSPLPGRSLILHPLILHPCLHPEVIQEGIFDLSLHLS